MSKVSHNVVSTPDLAYRVIDGIELHADIHRPEIDEPAPTVVYIHGGGWAVGDRKDFLDTRLLPMARAGVAVVSIQYRFTDLAPFPAQLVDARAAVRWVKDTGPSYGLDVTRIGSWGSSAGGTIAALLGLPSPLDDAGRLTDTVVPPLAQAVVAWQSPLDMRAVFARSWLEAEEMPVEGSEPARYIGSATYDPTNPMHRAADPARLVTAQAAPFLFVGGDRDHLVSLGATWRVHDQLTVDGVESSVLVLGGTGHEGVELDRTVVIEASAQHFKRHLCSPPTTTGSDPDRTGAG